VNGRAFVGLGKGYSGKKARIQEYAAPNYAGMDEAPIFCQKSHNPSKGILRISTEISIEQLQLFDSYGKSCYHQTQYKGDQLELDLSHLPTGVYYARILVANGQFLQKQIIIE